MSLSVRGEIVVLRRDLKRQTSLGASGADRVGHPIVA
jgi:hypothetical protein